MKISLSLIKELRSITAASVSDCRNALEETGSNIEKAVSLLRKRGLEHAAKNQDSVSKEGRIETYVHLGNKIGVLLEVDCQTDFVARNGDFCQFTKDIAMQIVACSPVYVKREDVPADVIEKETDKELFYRNNCLLDQVFVKDPSIAIKDYLGSLIAKFSENIVIRRFTCYKIGK